MIFACVWTMIVDYPLNKHCIWILSLCVLEQFMTDCVSEHFCNTFCFAILFFVLPTKLVGEKHSEKNKK